MARTRNQDNRVRRQPQKKSGQARRGLEVAVKNKAISNNFNYKCVKEKVYGKKVYISRLQDIYSCKFKEHLNVS